MSEPREYSHDYGPEYDRVSDECIELSELLAYEDLKPVESMALRVRLEDLVEKWPDYMDAYLLLYQVYERWPLPRLSSAIIKRGYHRVLGMITDDDGRLPERMPWGWIDNRPLLRVVAAYALDRWQAGPAHWKESITVHAGLLMICPDDNMGMRYQLLALLEHMTYDDFKAAFLEWNDHVGMIYKAEREPWFVEHAKNHVHLQEWLGLQRGTQR